MLLGEVHSSSTRFIYSDISVAMDPNKEDSSFSPNEGDGLDQGQNRRDKGKEAMQSETGAALEQSGGTKSKGMQIKSKY